jgi:predicted Zn-dependent protease
MGSAKFGTLLHDAIHEAFVVESSGWAVEQVTRVAERLQTDVSPEERLAVEVPWMSEATAFIVPGRFIYVSRHLLETCVTDEAVAFVVAHELAHQRLGHVVSFPDWLVDVPGSQLPFLIQGVYRSLQSRLFGPEAEVAADRLAIGLCLKAGYDAMACLAIFDILEKQALDAHDLGMVYGPQESDDELAPDASFATRMRIWLWQRRRGYLPLRDRRQEILRHLGESRGVHTKGPD